MKLVKQGDESYFGKHKVAILHFEFSSMCNQKCSYCLEGNGNPNKEPALPSTEINMIKAIEKIFKSVDTNDSLGFILVGGEPTVQPALPAVVAQIKSRANTNMLLTTNLSQSVDYYQALNIPIIASMHMDHVDPCAFLTKVISLRDLIAHVRIMAHPGKMDVVREAWNHFMEAAKHTPLNFTMEEVLPFGDYLPNYNTKDLAFIKDTHPVHGEHSQNLKNKLGVFSNLFRDYQWTYINNGILTTSNEGPNNFKNFYCERNLLIMRSNGELLQGYGCGAPTCNIFNNELPDDIFSTVVCKKQVCGVNFGFTLLLPKYSHPRYAPEYVDSSNLRKLKFRNLFKTIFRIK